MPQPKNMQNDPKPADVKPVEHTEEQPVTRVVEEPVSGPPAESNVREVSTSRMRFTKERLMRDGAALVGVPGHILAGALADSDKEDFTIEQAKQAAENWLASPVKEA